jgi:hypothetical protein
MLNMEYGSRHAMARLRQLAAARALLARPEAPRTIRRRLLWMFVDWAAFLVHVIGDLEILEQRPKGLAKGDDIKRYADRLRQE